MNLLKSIRKLKISTESLIGIGLSLGVVIGYPVETQAEEKFESHIEDSTKDYESVLEIPKRIPNLSWDEKGIRVVHEDLGAKQKYKVILRGKIKNVDVESFTYQVDGFNAHAIKLTGNKKEKQFDVEVPLVKSPARIRLWLEVIENRGPKIYSDFVVVKSKFSTGSGSDAQGQ